MKTNRSILLIALLSFFSVIYGETDVNFNAEKNFTDPNGTITVDPNGSVDSGIDWIGNIYLNGSKRALIVIEDMLLDEEDNLTIIDSNNKPIFSTSGVQVSFSVFPQNVADNIQIHLKTSSNKIKRTFRGYYNVDECKYIITKDFGSMSTPILNQDGDVACSFILHPSETSYSKRSVTFLNSLSSQKVSIKGSGSQDQDYTGSEIPPEIIGKDVNTELALNFTLKTKTMTDRINFTYEIVQKESEFIKLSGNQTVKYFNYSSLVASPYQPEAPHCHWIIESEEKTVIYLTFDELSLTKGAHIIISDGKDILSKQLRHISSLDFKNLNGTYIISTGKFLRVSLILSDGKIEANAQVRSHSEGGYLENSGKIDISKSSEDTIFLLEVGEEENVVLQKSDGNLLENGSIYIYNDFSVNSKLLLVFKEIPQYPIVSDTSRMMIIAKDFIDKASYKAEFKGVSKGCYRMTSDFSYDFVVSGNCDKDCLWIVPPDDKYQIISLHMHLLNFEKDDIITINLLDKNNTKYFDVVSKSDIPEIYLPSKLGYIMKTKNANCKASDLLLHVNFEKMNGCDKIEQLSPGKKLQITSPNYPDSYPLLAQCWTNITSNNTVNKTSSSIFHVTFKELNISPLHCLNFWQNFASKSPQNTNFTGNHSILPDDLLFQPDVAVEFDSKPCIKSKNVNLDSDSGFSLNVTSADCGGIIKGDGGNFSAPDYPNKTSLCIWILEITKSTDDSHPNIINFTVTLTKDKGSELTIYDGGSVRDVVLKNISSKDMLSRTNKLVFVYKRNGSSSASGLHVMYQLHNCEKVCQNGLCLHADWVCNNVNDCGDNTDELQCSGAPLPPGPTETPTPAPSHGVSPVALGLGLPIAFILGILATLFVPPLYRRFRSSQYHQFRDISAEA